MVNSFPLYLSLVLHKRIAGFLTNVQLFQTCFPICKKYFMMFSNLCMASWLLYLQEYCSSQTVLPALIQTVIHDVHVRHLHLVMSLLWAECVGSRGRILACAAGGCSKPLSHSSSRAWTACCSTSKLGGHTTTVFPV
jgi:hypothetical protein